MSSGSNGKMLDTGLLYEAMKAARPIPCPVVSHSAPGGSPTPALAASPTATPAMSIYDSENNLNKGGNGDKGYTDKHVLNIDKDNYMLKRGPPPTPVCSSSSVRTPSTTNSNDQVLFNVTTSSECRSNVLTCLCRPQSMTTGGGGSLLSYTAAGGGSLSHSNGTTSPNQRSNVSHTVSSLLPLVECWACYHNVCTPYAATYPCARPHNTLPPPTLPDEVVSTHFTVVFACI